MGNKIDPNLLRISGGQRPWSSEWCATTVSRYNQNVYEDIVIAEYLKESKISHQIGKIKIKRLSQDPSVTITAVKSSSILVKGGDILKNIKEDLSTMLGKNVNIDIAELRRPDLNAQIVASNIAKQIEKRSPYKRAVKTAIDAAVKSGALGIKVRCAGRLNGAEIARSEYFKHGSIPAHTIRANIDYAQKEANTIYGKIGIKVWIYVSEFKSKNN